MAGVCLAGAVHDFIILWASTRRGGRSLAQIAREEIGPVAGGTAAVAILFIIVIALAGLGLAVVNALQESAWGTFTIGTSIPLALFMGLYMYRFRKGRIAEATAIGVAGLLLAVILGKPIAASAFGRWFHLSREQLIVAMGAYGFVASVLPVWLLLCPRDYLSSFMKIGTIAFLVVAVMIVNPELQMPAINAVHRRRRTDHSRAGLPVRVHHHRVRRHLRLPRADRVGHDAEDDRPRERHPPDRLRRDADRGARRRRRADRRRRRCIPGDYFAINTLARHVRQPRHPDRQPAAAREPRSARPSPAAPAARSRWRSASRRSSPACPACAG